MTTKEIQGKLMGKLGAVIVSTPQDVALKDAVKGITMFRKVDVPVHFPSSSSPPPFPLLPVLSAVSTTDTMVLAEANMG